MVSKSRKAKAVAAKTVKRWAIFQKYNPFVMGGSVWRWYKYQVNAHDVKLANKFKGFVFFQPVAKKFQVHELITGGLLGEGKNRSAAVLMANVNIKTTPDLKEQMEVIGPSSNHEEMVADEAYRILAKSTE